MSKKISNIYDVASKAGTSIATVSRVLNNPDMVSPKTKDKVFTAMKELNFTPKADARERARKETGRIGVITNNLTSPSFTHRLRGISEILQGSPYELVIISMDDKKDINSYLQSVELTNRLDGLIILSQKLNISTLNILKKLSIIIIFIEFGEEGFYSITIDNLLGGKIVADYLINKKYKSFAVLTELETEENFHPNQLRLKGFKDQLKVNGFTLKRNMIFYSPYDLSEAIKKAEEILTNRSIPEVIFATTDYMAIAVIKAAKKLNITIPDKLGLIGFDGTHISEYMDLTTVDQSLEESGRVAAHLIMKKLKDPMSPIHSVTFPLRIIERETIK